jgi:hypothetical protein
MMSDIHPSSHGARYILCLNTNILQNFGHGSRVVPLKYTSEHSEMDLGFTGNISVRLVTWNKLRYIYRRGEF